MIGATNWRLAVVVALAVALLGGWQVMVIVLGADAAAVPPLREKWWHFIVLLVVLAGGWQLIRVTAMAHAQLRVGERGWQRWLLASLPAILFTAMGLYAWEMVVVGMKVPMVLLPPPSGIAVVFGDNLNILWRDFVQTVIKSVVPGYLLGCGAGLCLAILAWRFPTINRGLLPLGNFMSVMPIVGVAPIMVMWFGFDWQSKAAVVVLITFFPMLVNALAGFAIAGQLERDLMHTYAAKRGTRFRKLILPAALPFIFNGLKVCATLALIGAIVAEFFGTPIVGMGFRISSEIGRMGLEMVWATIMVSALVGTSTYGLLVLLERSVTFWDPSWRGRT